MPYYPEPYNPPADPTPEQLVLATLYQTLRLDMEEFESLIGKPDIGQVFTEKELKRLDKAVVLINTGLKITKKVLKAQGFTKLKPILIKTEEHA
jgi:hypothetical protein